MDIKIAYWVLTYSSVVLVFVLIPILYFTKKQLNTYKKRCDTYLESFENIVKPSIGRLHISQIDEHKAPEIYLEIYKDSYQRLLNRSVAEACIVLDTVVDSQDKQAL